MSRTNISKRLATLSEDADELEMRLNAWQVSQSLDPEEEIELRRQILFTILNIRRLEKVVNEESKHIKNSIRKK